MSTLMWGALVLILFPLLQIPVLIYISRYLEVENNSDSATIDADTTSNTDTESLYPPPQDYWIETGHQYPFRSVDSGSRGQTESSTITCPRCGTENDRAYTYCRNCVARLPTMGAEPAW